MATLIVGIVFMLCCAGFIAAAFYAEDDSFGIPAMFCFIIGLLFVLVGFSSLGSEHHKNKLEDKYDISIDEIWGDNVTYTTGDEDCEADVSIADSMKLVNPVCEPVIEVGEASG